MNNRHFSSYRRQMLSVGLVSVSFTFLLIAGCASTPEPVGEIASARTAISSVDDSTTRRISPVRLDRAKSKLQRAEAAMKQGNNADAKRLAEEALADARLARSEADAVTAERSATELENSIRVLRSEIDRAQSSM